jgi:transposase
MHHISSATLDSVVSLLLQGHSTRDIAFRTGVGLGTVVSICQKHCPDAPRLKAGHPSPFTAADTHQIIRLVTNGHSSTASEVAKIMENTLVHPVHPQTVCCALKAAGLYSVVKKKKPALKPHQKRACFEFAERHLHWTVEDWKSVVWSDETKINCLGSDGLLWAWKKPGEELSLRLIQPTVKHGGGHVMIWGCMFWDGPGYGTRIEGKMDKELYCAILEDELQEFLAYYNKTPEDVIFQQDNDPKHTSKLDRKWFSDHGYAVLI